MLSSTSWRVKLITPLVALASFAALSPAAYAAFPGSTGNYPGGSSSAGPAYQPHTVPQSTLVNAIMAVPVNKSTAPNAGDGGWVW